MSLETYDVYFSGALLKDSDPEKVKRKIGAMFKLEGDRLERLFSGKPMPIKRGVDMDRAIKYRVAFRDAGGLVDIVPTGQPAPTPKPPAPARPQQTQTENSVAADKTQPLTLADGPLEVPQEPPHKEIIAPDYPLSSNDGFDLSDCTVEPPPQEIPDISTLDLTKPGSQLDETAEPEPLEIDTTALELDSSDDDLDDQTPPEPPVIDTHSLSLSAANQGSLEDCQTPVEAAPIPNLDHLKIVEGSEKESPGKAEFKLSDD
ncbi:MAG: hypothetical protein ABW170_04010 [Candidatus Thiodiazotropha sp. L084R]